LVTIVIHEVVIDILADVKDVTVFVREDTDLDLGSRARARGSGVEGGFAIILSIVDHRTFKEGGGINVTILFHVLDLLAFLVARVAVDVVVLELALVSIIGVLLVVPVATLLASFAHLLLELLLVLNSGFEVSLKVDDVLSVVVVTAAARVFGAQAEDNESLGGKDSGGVLIVGEIVIVRLDELALLELDGVAGDINLVSVTVLFEFTDLRVLGGAGSTHQVGDIRALGRVLALGRSEGGGDSGTDCNEGKSEFHGI
jgi:hypothetical protein